METIEQALREVAELHERVTQSPVPEIGPQAFAPFPPGVDPVAFAIDEVARLRELIDATPRPDPAATTGPSWVPRSSILAGPTAWIVAVELPGVTKEDVSVTVDGNELVVSGERKPPAIDPAWKPLMMEQAWGRFERRFPIPPRSNPEKVIARCQHGILEIEIPAAADSATPGFRVQIS